MSSTAGSVSSVMLEEATLSQLLASPMHGSQLEDLR